MKLRDPESTNPRVARLYHFLTDDIYDLLPQRYQERGGPEWPWNFLEKYVEEPTKKILCKIYGHEPARDMCNIPEHDYCVWCNKSMPDMAERRNA